MEGSRPGRLRAPSPSRTFDSSACTLRFGEHRVLLGRCLAAAGAPVGEKNDTHPEQLPDWLPDSSMDTQRAFARIYLLTRASVREHEPRFVIREQRPNSYHEQLVALLERVAGEDTISRSGHNIHVHSHSADTILEG